VGLLGDSGGAHSDGGLVEAYESAADGPSTMLTTALATALSTGGDGSMALATTRGFGALAEALEAYHQGREGRNEGRNEGRSLEPSSRPAARGPAAAGGLTSRRRPSSDEAGAAAGETPRAIAAVVAAWRRLPSASAHHDEALVPYFYAVLGCRTDASAEELRRAYRQLALRWHPDKHTHRDAARQAEAHERFQSLAAAWAVLSDETLRAAYDADCVEADWDSQRV